MKKIIKKTLMIIGIASVVALIVYFILMLIFGFKIIELINTLT